MNNKKILLSVIFVIFVVILGGSSLLYLKQKSRQAATNDSANQSQSSQKVTPVKSSGIELEMKIRKATDPGTCGPGEMIRAIGYVLEKGVDYIVIRQNPGNPDVRMKLNTATLYLKIYVDKNGSQLSQEEINFDEIASGQSLVAFGFFSSQDEEVQGKLIKIIISK